MSQLNYKLLLQKYYQNKFDLTVEEAILKAQGEYEEDDKYIYHYWTSISGGERRDVYLNNLGELLLVRSEEKNKDYWVTLV